MYRSALISLVVLLFCSCNEQINFDRGVSKAATDRITLYYKNAQDNNLPLDERLRFTNLALQSLEEQKSDSLYPKLLYQKSWLQLSMGQYDSLIKSDRLLQDIVSPIEAAAILGMQHYLMGYYFEQVAQKPDSAFHRYNRSRFYYKQTNDSSWIGKNLLNMAKIQQTQSDYFGSKETLTEAIQYIESEEDPNTIASAYNSLGTNHRKLFNYTDALGYYLRAIKTSDAKVDISTYKNNLATVYIDLKSYDKARSILEGIVNDTVVKFDARARVLDNLAYANWLSGRAVPANDFLEPLRLRKQQEDKRGLLASYTHLGEYYSKTEPQRAMGYLDSVIDLSKELKAPRAELDALKLKMELIPNRIALRDRYIFLQDSLYRQELKVKTQFAKYKYDDRIKQEAILRLEKENAEAELEAAQERNMRYWFLGGTVFLSSVLGIGYYSNRQRIKRLKAQNRADRVEASYATEAALSQRLHDDFGAGLHHLMLLVQSKADAEKILDELDILYQQSRDFSREINAVDTGVNFKEALYTMLNAQKPEETRLLIVGAKDISWQSLSNVSKITLYKVLRELFINMSKHSKASLVTLNLKQFTKALEIQYSDNGVGIDTSKGFEKNGLLITEKRMDAIGGTIIFESDHGIGLKAVIRIPN
ncbi:MULTISPECIES: tetratricopeptide repeat protein [unclassified Leeuwenhoekiella]|uniref:tetratricopeptide repeat-containing sensor histidine kinase n=1 Tax=unclassified Leeuwenhoekiella TaxID=2615029 RepID=UPI000C61FC67|nr:MULTISPECIES: tetratricopeptide repeat protein [unclassified Leeuwenhoekiella]MAW96936.1 hypothetical protein [Leeuwenhoekiella sp.]MBA80640.1 hypothetical protein [Leeuwenhoekiella sp.]